MNDLIPNLPSAIDDLLGSLRYIYAELALSAGFILALLADLLFSRRSRYATLACTLLGLAVAAWFTVAGLSDLPGQPVFGGMVRPSHTGGLFKLVFYLVSALFLFFSFNNRETVSHSKGTGDLCIILLGTVLGMNLMAMASNLLMIYLSIEMVSIGSYLLVGYNSVTAKQSEAAIKYALFGAAASAIMLYGISLLYSFTGSLGIFDPAFLDGLRKLPPMAALVPLVLLLAGISFKLSLVPMHLWVPDVYEGAPTPVTAFLATGPKLAGFAMLLLVAGALSGPGSTDLYPILSILAVAAMIAGNFAALWQDDIKRMLAYSSIGHTGFMMMAITAGGVADYALLYYALVYSLATFAVFLLADHLSEQTGSTLISSYKGTGRAAPLAMLSMVISLVSLTGIPPTSGFFAKLLIFSSLWQKAVGATDHYARAMLITGAVTTVVSLFYYFKVPLNGWLRIGDKEPAARFPADSKVYLAAGLTVLVVLLGLFPSVVG